MLKMNFRKGAIVRLGFNCQVVGVADSGRVIDVTEEEIVLIPQIMVQFPYANGTYPPSIMWSLIDKFRTVDSNRKVHIDRKLIASWEYYSVESRSIQNTVYKSKDIEETLVSEYQYVVNNYDKDGHCKGNGDFFEH